MAITNNEITVGSTVNVLPNNAAVPAGKNYAITGLLLTNIGAEDPTGANDSVFTIHAIASGGVGDASNYIVNTALLPGAETFTLDTEKIILGAGDHIDISVAGTGQAGNTAPKNVSAVLSYLDV